MVIYCHGVESFIAGQRLAQHSGGLIGLEILQTVTATVHLAQHEAVAHSLFEQPNIKIKGQQGLCSVVGGIVCMCNNVKRIASIKILILTKKELPVSLLIVNDHINVLSLSTEMTEDP